MIIVSGTVSIQPDKREEAIEAALNMANATHEEAGCITYMFYADLSDPNTFRVYEEWETADALKAHFNSAHMAEFNKILPEIVAGPVNIKRYMATEMTDV